MEQAFIDIFQVNAYVSKTKKQLLAIMEQRLSSLIDYLQKQNQANYNGALPRLYQSYALLMIKFADQLSACGEQASSQSSLVDSASIVDKLNWAKANITQRQIGFFAHYYSYWRSNSNQTASSSAERHYLHNATLQQELESRLNAFQNQQKLENGSCSCQ
jgi:hypothetical protein